MKQGWEIKRLSELFNVQSSKRVHKSDWRTEGIPFYRAREVVKLANNGFVDNELFISEDLFKEFTKYKGAPKKDDIIISAVGTLGKCYLVKDSDRFYIKDASVLWFSKISDVYSRYIEYAFESKTIRDQIFNNSMGATVGTLTISRAKKIEIPISPLPEQKRIVAILDKCFEAIDKARTNVECNLQNAKDLFQSQLNQIFSQKGKGWVEKKLGDICDVRDGTHDSPRYVDDGIPFVTQKNIQTDGLSFEKVKFIKEEDHTLFHKRSNVAFNDILISMIGANRGMVCIVDDKRVFSIKNVGLIKSNNHIDQRYILYYLKSPLAKEYVLKSSKGSAQGFIGLGKLREFPIPFITLKNQIQITNRLDEISCKTSNLESKYQKELEALGELKKSILQKAFNGELTTKEEIAA